MKTVDSATPGKHSVQNDSRVGVVLNTGCYSSRKAFFTE